MKREWSICDTCFLFPVLTLQRLLLPTSDVDTFTWGSKKQLPTLRFRHSRWISGNVYSKKKEIKKQYFKCQGTNETNTFSKNWLETRSSVQNNCNLYALMPARNRLVHTLEPLLVNEFNTDFYAPLPNAWNCPTQTLSADVTPTRDSSDLHSRVTTKVYVHIDMKY